MEGAATAGEQSERSQEELLAELEEAEKAGERLGRVEGVTERGELVQETEEREDIAEAVQRLGLQQQ